MHGKGFFTIPNKETYEGDFILNVREGQGVLKLQNGTTISGSFKNGKPNGDMISILYPNGDTYQGTMVDGEIDIYGTLVKTSNDTSYTG